MALAFDGHVPIAQGAGSTNSATISVSANALVLVAAWYNGVTLNSISDVAGLTWNFRAQGFTSALFGMDVWWANAPAGLSSDAITVHFSGAATNGGFIWAVTGHNIASPFDPGGPQTGSSGNGSITTTNANTFIYYAARSMTVANPTPGAGWTQTDSPATVGFSLVEYQIVSATQTGLLGNWTTGNLDQGGWVMDAIVAAGAVGTTPTLGIGGGPGIVQSTRMIGTKGNEQVMRPHTPPLAVPQIYGWTSQMETPRLRTSTYSAPDANFDPKARGSSPSQMPRALSSDIVSPRRIIY